MKKAIPVFLILLLLTMMVPLPSYADYGVIQIDGYYDDWEDKPHAEVYYGEKPNVSDIHMVSVFRDETDVYVHVKMSEKGFNRISNFYFVMDTNQGSKAYQLELNSINDGNYGTAGIKVRDGGNWQNVIGSGYYTRAEGKPDEAEFNIILSSLFGNPDEIYDISIMSTNLGPQKVISVGASTGPYIAVAIGAGIVLISLGYFYYRKKRGVHGQ